MHRNTKVATCCYCGTRAALVLDAGRHELTCQGCGAPLHELKALPVLGETFRGRRGSEDRYGGSTHRSSDFGQGRRPVKAKGKKIKKKKSKSKRFFEEAFDFLEDIFD